MQRWDPYTTDPRVTWAELFAAIPQLVVFLLLVLALLGITLLVASGGNG